MAVLASIAAIPSPGIAGRSRTPPRSLQTRLASANIGRATRGSGMAEGLLGGILGRRGRETGIGYARGCRRRRGVRRGSSRQALGGRPRSRAQDGRFSARADRASESSEGASRGGTPPAPGEPAHQLSEQGLRRFGMRLRVAFQLFLALLGAAIGLGLIVMVYDAFHSRKRRGGSLRCAAGARRARLERQGACLGIVRRHNENSGGYPQQRRPSIAFHRLEQRYFSGHPETGLSIGQLQRILKSRFGPR